MFLSENEKVKIIIKKRGHIPGIGNGPILKPTSITYGKYLTLKKLGYPIEIIESVSTVSNIIKNSVKDDTPKVDESKPVVKEEVVEEKTDVKEEIVEETSTDKEIEEIIDNDEDVISESAKEEDSEDESYLTDDPDLSADSVYTRDFLTSKNICKKILDARKIQYDNSSASLGYLRKLVLDSNPNK